MEKLSVFNFFGILAAFSLTTHAMEAPTPLEELQKIVRNSFQPAPYQYQREWPTEDDNNKISEALSKSKNPDFFISNLPWEVIINICQFIDDNDTFLKMKETCHFFNAVSHLPFFYLTDHCLTETRPHSIPLSLLHLKTQNTPDGLFKLAKLYSISAQDLSNWFEKEFLRAALRKKNITADTLPTTLEGQTEEELDNLYPILKVALAANSQQDNIVQLFQSGPLPSSHLSLDTLRILSLNLDQKDIHYKALESLFFHLAASRSRNQDVDPDHQPLSVIARDLLMAGRMVELINNQYYVCTPQKKEVAIQIIQWCAPNSSNFQYHDILIQDAVALGDPELASQILDNLINLPDNPDLITAKIHSLIRHTSLVQDTNNERVQSQINAFSTRLFRHLWGTLSIYNKKDALILFMRAGHDGAFKAAFDELFLQPEMTSEPPTDELIANLFAYGYSDQATRLLQRLLDNGHEYSILSSIKFFDRAKIDRLKAVSVLKTLIESSKSSDNSKLEALRYLAERESTNEVDYIREHLASLKDENLERGDYEFKFSFIYFYLNEEEKCNLYYQKAIDIFLQTISIPISEVLENFRKNGLKLRSLEELRIQDPIKILKIMFE